MPLDSKPAQLVSTLFSPTTVLDDGLWPTSCATRSHRFGAFLAEVGYYSSFTPHGGWYTLRSIRASTATGVVHRDVGFSR